MTHVGKPQTIKQQCKHLHVEKLLHMYKAIENFMSSHVQFAIKKTFF
ncbi:hypothetical protein BAZMOX_11336_0 [methanotrophic endosymbiont of Bathymodiolus azoricus (Menez Gwen)]|nr:hypothetical protein BAZMOX_11336_0 [methanotrophic endosymbiont of Bathymodiolus azoricus (Menez Gwen)]